MWSVALPRPAQAPRRFPHSRERVQTRLREHAVQISVRPAVPSILLDGTNFRKCNHLYDLGP